MAKVEDDNLNFEEMNLPGEESAQVEIADEAATVSPVESDAEVAVAEEEAPLGEMEKEPGKMPFYLACAGAAALPVILLVLASAQMIFPSTAIYLVCIGLIPFGLWMSRESNTIYTVFLGCALIAILTAVYCLWSELGRYEFDIHAKEAKQRVSMTLPVEHGHSLVSVEQDLA